MDDSSDDFARVICCVVAVLSLFSNSDDDLDFYVSPSLAYIVLSQNNNSLTAFTLLQNNDVVKTNSFRDLCSAGGHLDLLVWTGEGEVDR